MTITQQRTDAPTKAARPSGEIEQALYDERDRVVNTLFQYGQHEGHCETLLAALGSVYQDHEPQWSDGKWRDSEGRDYYGCDAEGYDREGWNRNTGLNREGLNRVGRTVDEQREFNRVEQEQYEARRAAERDQYRVQRSRSVQHDDARWCSACQMAH